MKYRSTLKSKASHFGFTNAHLGLSNNKDSLVEFIRQPQTKARRVWARFFFALIFVFFTNCASPILEVPEYVSVSNEELDNLLGLYTKAYFVSHTGKDTNDGSEKNPFKTIQKALDSVQVGEAVFIRDGIYNERIKIDKSGTKKQNIIISAYNNENVIIDAKNLSGLGETNSSGKINWENGVLEIRGQSNIIIHGIKIINSKSSGIYCGGVSDANGWSQLCKNIKIYKCKIENCLAPAICIGSDFSPSENIFVIENEVINCAQVSREAISIRSVDKFEIARNTISKVKKESIDAKAGCKNGLIHNNIISEIGYESSYPACGIYLDAWSPKISGKENQNYSIGDGTQRNIRVYANIIKNLVHPKNNATAIAVASESGNIQENIFIYNNLVYNTGVKCGAGIKVAKNSDIVSGLIQNVFIYNNTIYGTDQQGLYVNFPNVKNIAFVNNISVATNAPSLALIDGINEQTVFIKNNILGNTPTHAHASNFVLETANDANALFVDVTLEDFRLKQNSFAIDKAFDKEIFGKKCVPTEDIVNVKRPRGKSYDVGAYEF